MDAVAFKEATAASHDAEVEGILALVEESKLSLEDLSDPVYVAKLKVNFMESLIRYKGQIPYKTCSSPRCLVRSHSLVCSENSF